VVDEGDAVLQVAAQVKTPLPAWARWAAVAISFCALVWLGGKVSAWLQPWRHAAAPHCLSFDQGPGTWINVCDVAVNVGHATLDGAYPPPQSFGFVTLQPGQADTARPVARERAVSTGKVWSFVCYAPHVPGLVAGLANPSITVPGCRRTAAL
jgi:hypothetical protein